MISICNEEGFKIKNLLVLLFITTMSLAACGQTDEQANEGDRIKIVTTFYPVYEFTKQVVAEHADVTMLIEAGKDSHNFEP